MRHERTTAGSRTTDTQDELLDCHDIDPRAARDKWDSTQRVGIRPAGYLKLSCTGCNSLPPLVIFGYTSAKP